MLKKFPHCLSVFLDEIVFGRQGAGLMRWDLEKKKFAPQSDIIFTKSMELGGKWWK